MDTNPNYWDCDCDINYIHPKTVPVCPRCEARAETQPDARQEEIDLYGVEADH